MATLNHFLTDNVVDIGADFPTAPLSEKELKAKLKEGETPVFLKESWELVDRKNPINEPFQDYMSNIAQTVLRDAGYSSHAEKLNVRFVLTDSDEVNAGIVSIADPPIMMFSRGFFKAVETREQLEGVILHELAHGKVNQIIGEHDNSKGEECTADLFATNTLYRAGRNPEALRNFLTILKKGKSLQNKSWADYVDPHPSLNLRIRANENLCEGLKEARGEYLTESQSLPDDIKQKFSEFYHRTVLQKILERDGYENLSISEKLNFILQSIPNVARWNQVQLSRRVNEFSKLVSDYVTESFQASDFSVDEVEKAQSAIIDAVVLADLEPVYKSICSINKQTHPATVQLSEAVSTLIESKKNAEREAAADIICKAADELHYPDGKILKKLQMAHFSVATEDTIKKADQAIEQDLARAMDEGIQDTDMLMEKLYEEHGVKMPWHPHVEQYLESKSENLLRALRMLGAKDPRFPELSKQSALAENRSSAGRVGYWTSAEDQNFPIISRPRPKSGFGATDYIQKAHITDKGYYVAPQKRSFLDIDRFLDPKHPSGYNQDRLTSFEKARLKSLSLKQEKISREIDWSGLENNFWEFIKKHEAALVPPSSIVDSDSPLHEVFVQKLSALVKKDAATYLPLVREFFTGRDDSSDEPILRNDKRLTLPAILDTAAIDNKTEFYDRHIQAFASLPSGISLDHPYLKFVLDDPFSLFTGLAAAKPVLDYSRWQLKEKLEEGESIEDILDPRVAKLAQFEKVTWESLSKDIKKQEPLTKIFKKFNRGTDSHEATISFSRAAKEEDTGYASTFDKGIHSLRLIDFTMNGDTPLNYYDTNALLNSLADQGILYAHPFFRYQAKTNARLDLSDDISAEELFKKYNIYTANSCFKEEPQLRRQYQQRLADRIHEIKDPGTATNLCEEALQQKRGMGPKFKNKVIKLWAIQMAQKIVEPSIFSSSPEEAFKRETHRNIRRMDINVLHPMMAQLCDELETSRELSYYVEDLLQEKGLRALGDNNIQAVFGEVLIDHVGTDSQLRQEIIEYLSAPENDISTSTLTALMEKNAGRVFTYAMEAYDQDPEDIPQAVKEDIVRSMHENYSSWPLELQGLFIEKVLFPVNGRLSQDGSEAITIDGEAKIIFDRAFPAGKASSAFARDYVECHLNELTTAGQRLYLAVIMASTKEQENDIGDNVSEMREAGRMVGRIFSKMHPIGAKFVQELESFDGTDSEFREGLRDVDVKSGIDLPVRWDLHHMLEKVEQEEAPDLLEGQRVGSTLGGGSVQLNVELEHVETKEKTATALLRDHVNERADRQYRIFSNALANFAKKHPQFENLKSVLDSSYRNLKIETDYNNAPQQAKNSQDVYEAGCVFADDIQVDFSAVPFKRHGKKYKQYGMAEGVHFNDLPVGTPEEARIKKAVAKAIMTRELTAMLRGQAVDSDRHGQQQKIVVSRLDDGVIKVHVQNFDDGAMALQPPTKIEQKALGEALGKFINLSLIKGKPITDAISQATETLENSAQGHYIETSKRGLRCIFGDYINTEIEGPDGKKNRLLSNNDVKDVLSAILRNGTISHHILYPAARQIGYKGLCKVHDKPLSLLGKMLRHPLQAVSNAFSLVSLKKTEYSSNVVIRDSSTYLKTVKAHSIKGTFNRLSHEAVSYRATNAIANGINISMDRNFE